MTHKRKQAVWARAQLTIRYCSLLATLFIVYFVFSTKIRMVYQTIVDGVCVCVVLNLFSANVYFVVSLIWRSCWCFIVVGAQTSASKHIKMEITVFDEAATEIQWMWKIRLSRERDAVTKWNRDSIFVNFLSSLLVLLLLSLVFLHCCSFPLSVCPLSPTRSLAVSLSQFLFFLVSCCQRSLLLRVPLLRDRALSL